LSLGTARQVTNIEQQRKKKNLSEIMVVAFSCCFLRTKEKKIPNGVLVDADPKL
jgi:hypothetical protein